MGFGAIREECGWRAMARLIVAGCMGSSPPADWGAAIGLQALGHSTPPTSPMASHAALLPQPEQQKSAGAARERPEGWPGEILLDCPIVAISTFFPIVLLSCSKWGSPR